MAHSIHVVVVSTVLYCTVLPLECVYCSLSDVHTTWVLIVVGGKKPGKWWEDNYAVFRAACSWGVATQLQLNPGRK